MIYTLFHIILSAVSEDTRSACWALWEAVLSFLTTLVQMQCAPAVTVLAQVLQKQWVPIVGKFMMKYSNIPLNQ